MINFDNSRAYGLPSYYVQQMFAANRGDVVLPTVVTAAAIAHPLTGGAIGVGTWHTRAEFKDLKVTRGATTVYQSDFSQGIKDWRFHGEGEWKVVDGALRQTTDKEDVRAVIGDTTWPAGYTYSLKARKLEGDEGFLVLFNLGSDDDRQWWNLGGWGNQRHGLEINGAGATKSGRIETNRWYDIRIETAGDRIKCFLDGKLVHDIAPQQGSPLFATAASDHESGEIILKVVNADRTAQAVEIRIDGAPIPNGPAARAETLTSPGAMDENSLDEPTKVAPKPVAITVDNGRIRHEFPANSLTVIRLKAKH